jgi:hypothetical protein
MRMARATASFIARRNITRRSSWSAMFSATSCASRSGRRISWISTKLSLPASLTMSLLSFSISAPFLPITMPGRAVWMCTRTFLAARSISIFGTPACDRRLRRNLRMARSCWSRSA